MNKSDHDCNGQRVSDSHILRPDVRPKTHFSCHSDDPTRRDHECVANRGHCRVTFETKRWCVKTIF